MARYETRIKVRFGDIDHAGIVYYPRIINYFHVAFEEFFSDRVGLPYHELLDDRKLGFPSVNVDVDFRETLAFGDLVRVEIQTIRMGESSLTLRYRIRKEGENAVCVEARITTVCVDMDTFKPVRIPNDLRTVLDYHQVSEE
jgi:YbgC/YbaW family acyl-CoA thioester hydrolase